MCYFSSFYLWFVLFFLLHFIEQFVEPLKVFLPTTPVAVGPFADFADCVRLQRAKILTAVALSLNQTRSFQIGQVLGNGLLRNRERLGQFIDRRGSVGQSIDNRPAGRIRQSGERCT